jgi:protein phosphatase-4 regulatory subunit 3
MGIIGDIEKIIKTLSRTAVVKEKMCEWMQREVGVLMLISDRLNSIAFTGLCSLLN